MPKRIEPIACDPRQQKLVKFNNKRTWLSDYTLLLGNLLTRLPFYEGALRFDSYRTYAPIQLIGNESVPIQLAQCLFPGLATSNVKM